jgi:hypothetical protein
MVTGFLLPCFSQNMFLLGVEYNILRPQFWDAGLGFNFMILNERLQNDFLITFGGIWAKDVETKTNAPRQRFAFSLRDSIYFSLDGRWAGFRAGIFASFGVFGVYDFPSIWDLVFNPGGFAGISLFPKSLVSMVIDICPGYVITFRINDGLAKNEAGFSLPLFLGLRFNMDKL